MVRHEVDSELFLQIQLVGGLAFWASTVFSLMHIERIENPHSLP
jgi:hypothetical protein